MKLPPRTSFRPTVRGADPEGLRLLQPLYDHIAEHTFCWNPEPEFRFGFQEPSLGAGVINFQPDEIAQQVELPHRWLSEEQLASLREFGEFDTPSSRPEHPFRWKVSDWVVKGQHFIWESLLNNICTAFEALYFIHQLFTESMCISFPTGWQLLVSWFTDLSTLLYGIPVYLTKEEQQEQEVAAELAAKEGQIVPQRTPQNKLRVFQLQRQKQMRQNKQISCLIRKWQLYQLILNESPVLETMREYTAADLATARQGSAALKAHLKQLLELHQLFTSWQNAHSKEVELGMLNYVKALKQNHSIRAKSETWLLAKEAELDQLLRKNNQLSKLWGHFVEYLERCPEQPKTPLVKAMVTRPALTPYNLLVRRTEPPQYLLETEIAAEVSSGKPLWVSRYFFLNWAYYTATAFIYFYFNAALSKVGLKALFVCETYYPLQTLDAQLRVVEDKSYQVQPWAVRLRECYHGMLEEREAFERGPPGLFGRCCSRIWNVIYSYLYLGFVWMFLCNLLAWPLVVIVCSLASTVMALLSFVYAGLFTLVGFLSHLLLHNEWIRPCSYLPFVTVSFKLALAIMVLALSAVLTVLMPVAALLLLKLALLRFVLKQALELVMMGLVRCLGKTPVGDNNMVWRIKGPGVGDQIFRTLKEQEVYVLFESKVQQKRLLTQHAQALKELGQSLEAMQAQKTLCESLRVQVDFQPLRQNYELCVQLLNAQFNQMSSKCPEMFNKNLIKLTRRQLARVRSGCAGLLAGHRAQGFDYLADRPTSAAVDELLAEALGPDCLQPLEQTELRMQIKTVKGSRFQAIANTIVNNAKLSSMQQSMIVLNEREERPVFQDRSVQPEQTVTVETVLFSIRAYSARVLECSPREWEGADLLNAFMVDPFLSRNAELAFRPEDIPFEPVDEQPSIS